MARSRDWAPRRARNVDCRPDAPILVVDDDVTICHLMAKGLEADGYRVVWTTDPAEAIGLVRGQRIALVVSDVNMPGMLGTALAAEIGRIQPGLRTLLVSGFADRRLRAEAEAIGAVLLSKPLRAEALSAAVGRLIGEPVAPE